MLNLFLIYANKKTIRKGNRGFGETMSNKNKQTNPNPKLQSHVQIHEMGKPTRRIPNDMVPMLPRNERPKTGMGRLPRTRSLGQLGKCMETPRLISSPVSTSNHQTSRNNDTSPTRQSPRNYPPSSGSTGNSTSNNSSDHRHFYLK